MFDFVNATSEEFIAPLAFASPRKFVFVSGPPV
jgi:hypothetical protein